MAKKPCVGWLHGNQFSDEAGILETRGRKQVRSITFDNIEDWNQKSPCLPAIQQEAFRINEIRLKKQ